MHEIVCLTIELWPNCFRAESYDEYSCDCDTWYEGEWCGSLNILMVSLTVVVGCWLAILVAVAVVTYRKK